MERFSRLAVLALILAGSVGVISPALALGRAQQVRTEAFKQLNRGVAAYKKSEYAKAVEHLEISAGLALNSFRAHFYLGLALIGDRQYHEALTALDIALDLDPRHLQSHVAQGDAHLKLGDLDQARAAYFSSLKLRPEYPPALDGLARIYEAGADDADAVEHFKRAIASDIGYAPAYTHLGDLYLRRKEYEEAVLLLEEAVSVRPDFADGLNRLSRAYGLLGLEGLAVATIRKAIHLEPNNPSHPATLGWLELAQGFDSTGERWLRRALELDSLHPEALMGLAEVARRRGDYDRAVAQVDVALADPRLDALTRKDLEAFRGEIETERTELAALELRTTEGEATTDDFAKLAGIYAGRGMWPRAAELQAQASGTEEHAERLAFMLFKAHRFREAHRIYAERATEIDDPVLEINTGVSLAMLGDDRGAVEAYRRALALQPDQLRAQVFLANSLLRLGQTADAARAFRRFLDLHDQGEAAERVRRILGQIAPDLVPPRRAEAENGS